MKIAVCQNIVYESKEQNLKKAAESVRKAADNGAELVILPEMFVCEFLPEIMKKNAEEDNGEIIGRLSESARENGVWLVGGTFPEICKKEGASGFAPSNLNLPVYYNTCPIFSPDGRLAAKYRKQHLFDVNVNEGGLKVSSTESDLFTAGSDNILFDTGTLKAGVAVCFDLRFPDLFSRMRDSGAELAVIPSAFSAATGPAHWELLLRARAADNRFYTAGAGAVSTAGAKFRTYAHSLVADPWGAVIASAGEEETVLFADISRDRIREVRSRMKLV